MSGNPSPPAVRALLERVREVAGLRLDLSDLDDEIDAYTAKVDEGVAERPDVAELVRAIEDQTAQDVDGDAIAAEIERFLRDQGYAEPTERRGAAGRGRVGPPPTPDKVEDRALDGASVLDARRRGRSQRSVGLRRSPVAPVGAARRSEGRNCRGGPPCASVPEQEVTS